MDSIAGDIRLAIRQLRRAPGFTAAAVVTLGLALGANTAMFGLVSALLLRPLPYADPDRLVFVNASLPDQEAVGLAPANYLDYARDTRALTAVAAYSGREVDLSAEGREPLRLNGLQVTRTYFDVLGTPARLGRTFTQSDREGAALAVLSDGAYARLFGRDPALVGRTLLLDRAPVLVVGVMGPEFEWRDDPDIWVTTEREVPPPPIAVSGDYVRQRGLSYFSAIGRLREGTTLDAARAEAAAVSARLRDADPSNNANRQLTLTDARTELVGDLRRPLLLLLGAVGLVLLIAAANVAGLFVARTAGRSRELGVRVALGASRWQIVRQLLVESLVIAAGGAALGLVLGAWTTSGVLAVVPEDLPRQGAVGVDWRVVLFTSGAALVAALICGLVPAIPALRDDAAEALRASQRVAGGHGAVSRLRRLLVIGEVALALMVTVGATLLATTLVQLGQVTTGFDHGGVATVSLSLPRDRYPDTKTQSALYARVVERVTALGGAPLVAAGFPMPFSDGSGSAAPLRIVGQPEPVGTVPMVYIGTVTPGFFRTMGVPLVDGRDFGRADTIDSQRVVVVNQAAARAFWPGRSPLGAEATFGGDDAWTVVGVVGDMRMQGVEKPPGPTVFFPSAQFTVPAMRVIGRGGANPGAFATAVRSTVREIDPELPVGQIGTLEEARAHAIAAPRFRAFLLSSFAALALVLAAIGVYGLLSASVVQRTREIGVRLALGESPRRIVARIVRDGAALAATGLVVGLGLTLASVRVVSQFLYGVTTGSVVPYAASASVLGAIAVAASLAPALRAARVDPVRSLRAE